VITPNDTVATEFAFASEFSKYEGENLGAFIDGSGCNAYLTDEKGERGINTEIGEYKAVNESWLDREVYKREEETLTFEMLTSGKIMGGVFKLTIKKLSEEHPSLDKLHQKLEDINDKEATAMLFNLVYGKEEPAIELKEKEQELLKTIGSSFTDRAVESIATMLRAITADNEKPTTLFVDGSLVTKNPDFLKAINARIKDEGGNVTLTYCKTKISTEDGNGS